MRAFTSFLTSVHPEVTVEPHLLPQDKLKQLMAEFVTKVRAALLTLVVLYVLMHNRRHIAAVNGCPTRCI